MTAKRQNESRTRACRQRMHEGMRNRSHLGALLFLSALPFPFVLRVWDANALFAWRRLVFRLVFRRIAQVRFAGLQSESQQAWCQLVRCAHTSSDAFHAEALIARSKAGHQNKPSSNTHCCCGTCPSAHVAAQAEPGDNGGSS